MTTAPGSRTLYDSSLTANAPHFAPPATPSRSPYKETLHRRSPTKQLRPGAKATVNYDEYQRLVQSEVSTAAEKELATRVVHAVEKLKDWCKEIEQWGWSGSFDKRHGTFNNDPFERVELSSSLPEETVENYDARLDSIDEELQMLEVDDLKEQILGIHLGRSRPSSSYSTASVSNLVLYDDFQLFVTELLLSSLPHHAKLKHYLKAWHIRLGVFREVPTYLSGLSFLEEILNEAWQGLKHAATPENDPKEIDDLSAQLTTAQSALRQKVSDLGKQLDRMLDMLEGQEDCLPDEWIDKYENNEKSYGEWSFEADRKLFHLQHLDRQPKVAVAPAIASPEPEDVVVADVPRVAEHVATASVETEPSVEGTQAPTRSTTEIEEEPAKVPEIATNAQKHVDNEEHVAKEISESAESSTDKHEKINTHEYEDIAPEQTVVNQYEDIAPEQIVTNQHKDIAPEAGVTIPSEHVEPASIAAESSEHVKPEGIAAEEFPNLSEQKTTTTDDTQSDQEEAVIAEVVHRPVEAILRRASVVSIESLTRDQVKSVDVPSRRSSVASLSSIKRPLSRSFDTPGTPPPADGGLRRSSRTTSPLATETTTEWPDLTPLPDSPRTPPPSIPTLRRNSGSDMTSPASDISDPLEAGEESPSVRASMNQSSKPPLNFAMKKRRSNHSIDASRITSNPFPDQDLSLDTSLPTIPASPTKSKSPGSPSVPLEEQISHILESLPARIKLKSSATPNAPEVKPKHKRKSSTSSNISTTSDAPRPGLRSRAATPSLTGRPGITLAPADEQGSRRGANDPEIKVYHLLSGNDKPLKLFIRRVGENGERVMVRVGGGWADLGEYLKTYAEHHGHRTVSEGKVEVLGLGNDRIVTPSSANGGRNSALGFRSDSRMEGPEGRSASRMSMRTESRQGMRSESRQSSLMGSIGYPSIGPGNGKDPITSSSATTVGTPGLSDDVPTPTSAATSANGSQRKSSAFWDEGGSLMGPAAVRKGSEISSEKKEWVDSVVEQAKKVGRKVEFGDLKKVGGTRRVFLKGRQASGSPVPGAGEKES